MVWHDDVFVNLELPSIAITKDSRDHHLRRFTPLKEIAVHVRASCHEIGHRFIRGLKPPFFKSTLQRGAKAPLYRSCRSTISTNPPRPHSPSLCYGRRQ